MNRTFSSLTGSPGSSRSRQAAFGRVLLALAALASIACQASSPGTVQKEQTATTSSALSGSALPSPATAAGSPAKTYGAALGQEPAVLLSEVLASPDAFQGKSVVVTGHVRRACNRKGCWMELASAKDDAGPGCRVTFKDYAFFVPTDSQGAEARVQGVVEITEVKKERVDHLEEEGARFAGKKDDGSATEVRIVATGVELTRT